MKIYQHDAGHMTEMAAMPIYRKNTLKSFYPGTSGPISRKLSMKHQKLRPIIVCSNDDPGLSLTYFFCKVDFAF